MTAEEERELLDGRVGSLEKRLATLEREVATLNNALHVSRLGRDGLPQERSVIDVLDEAQKRG